MPFALAPQQGATETSYAHSHVQKGHKYHEGFSAVRSRRMIWDMEQEVLHHIGREFGPFQSHLDFAAGTGRIAALMSAYARAQYLLDISESMISVAMATVPHARFIRRDFREGVPELPLRSQDLITAFRFFPNAELELRRDAMGFIAERLKQGAFLVCNNHRNFWSVPWVARRVSFRGGITGMTSREMIDLGREFGLSVVRLYSMGVIPQRDQWALLPWAITEPLEQFFFRHAGTRHRLGYNVVYVFKRD